MAVNKNDAALPVLSRGTKRMLSVLSNPLLAITEMAAIADLMASCTARGSQGHESRRILLPGCGIKISPTTRPVELWYLRPHDNSSVTVELEE